MLDISKNMIHSNVKAVYTSCVYSLIPSSILSLINIYQAPFRMPSTGGGGMVKAAVAFVLYSFLVDFDSWMSP